MVFVLLMFIVSQSQAAVGAQTNCINEIIRAVWLDCPIVAREGPCVFIHS